MKIRLARQEDIKELIEFDHIAQSRTGNNRKDFIKRSVLNKRCYVAVSEEKPVGYIVLEYNWFYFDAFVSMLYIKGDFRRKGIGSELMKYIENKCKAEKLFTSTNQSNTPMQNLLDKLGYKRSGSIYNLDPDNPELIYFKKNHK